MTRIDHVHVHASDPARTIAFFEKYFEGKVVGEDHVVAGRKITSMSIGSEGKVNILHIPPSVSDPDPDAAAIDHFAIEVDNIEELVQQLQADGYTFRIPLSEGGEGAKIAFVLGPDNVYIEIAQRA